MRRVSTASEMEMASTSGESNTVLVSGKKESYQYGNGRQKGRTKFSSKGAETEAGQRDTKTEYETATSVFYLLKLVKYSHGLLLKFEYATFPDKLERERASSLGKNAPPPLLDKTVGPPTSVNGR
jgi:hypothetical protein